jgi:Glycosyltransferase family 87
VKSKLWLVLALAAAIAAWFYVNRILDPWEQYVDVEQGSVRARMGDLYAPWTGARALLLHGQNPYSRQVSDEIQIGFYGHPLDQDYRSSNVLDEQRFAYPVYVVFLIAPIAYTNFAQAQAWMTIVLAVLTTISVVLWMSVLRWRPPKVLTIAIVLLVLSSPQVIQGLRLRQLGLAVGFLLSLGVWCIARNRLSLGGAVFALATIKPQMLVLPLAYLVLWGASSWPRRSRLLIGFGSALAVLAALGEIILPGWPRFFVQGLIAYSNYNPISSLLRTVAGQYLGIAVSLIMVFATVALGWRHRNAGAASLEFDRTLAAFLVCGSLVMPLIPQFNQVLLLLPVLMFARDWSEYPAAIRRLATVFVPWLWLTYVGLLLFRPSIRSGARFPLLPSALALFVPFLLLMQLGATPREAGSQVNFGAPSAS